MRREITMQVLATEEQVMKRDNHKIWRWRTTYTLEARAAVKQGKSTGGRSPLTPEVLLALLWQVIMELDRDFGTSTIIPRRPCRTCGACFG